MADVAVDADRFGAVLSDLLHGLGDAVETNYKPEVRSAGVTARREWRSNWKAVRAGKGNGSYGPSISFRVTDAGDECHVEVGSATLPGLPHLLEKGHATIGGGYVPGKRHIEPAADSAFDEFERAVSEAVDRAIGSI